MRTVSKLFAGLSVAAVAAGVAALYGSRSRPVLYAIAEEGDPANQPLLSVFNPFRDRSPERAAEVLLEDLRQAEYSKSLALIDNPDVRALVTTFQRRGHLRSWRLRNRQDSERTSRLFYWITWGESGSTDDGPLWVTLRRSATGREWKVTECKSW